MSSKCCHEKSEEISLGGSMNNRLFSIKDTVNCPCKHRLCHDKDLACKGSHPYTLCRFAGGDHTCVKETTRFK